MTVTLESLRDGFFYFLVMFAAWALRIEWLLSKVKRPTSSDPPP